MPDNSAAITALRNALNTGVTSVTVDGQAVTFRDAGELRKRLAELEAADPAG